MSQTKVVQKIKTHILCAVTLFSENRAVSEIMWKNRIKPDRPQMTIWRMRFGCWVTKATDTHSEYVIFIAFFFLSNSGYANAPQCCVVYTVSYSAVLPDKKIVMLPSYSTTASLYTLTGSRVTGQKSFRLGNFTVKQ